MYISNNEIYVLARDSMVEGENKKDQFERKYTPQTNSMMLTDKEKEELQRLLEKQEEKKAITDQQMTTILENEQKELQEILGEKSDYKKETKEPKEIKKETKKIITTEELLQHFQMEETLPNEIKSYFTKKQLEYFFEKQQTSFLQNFKNLSVIIAEKLQRIEEKFSKYSRKKLVERDKITFHITNLQLFLQNEKLLPSEKNNRITSFFSAIEAKYKEVFISNKEIAKQDIPIEIVKMILGYFQSYLLKLDAIIQELVREKSIHKEEKQEEKKNREERKSQDRTTNLSVKDCQYIANLYYGNDGIRLRANRTKLEKFFLQRPLNSVNVHIDEIKENFYILDTVVKRSEILNFLEKTDVITFLLETKKDFDSIGSKRYYTPKEHTIVKERAKELKTFVESLHSLIEYALKQS